MTSAFLDKPTGRWTVLFGVMAVWTLLATLIAPSASPFLWLAALYFWKVACTAYKHCLYREQGHQRFFFKLCLWLGVALAALQFLGAGFGLMLSLILAFVMDRSMGGTEPRTVLQGNEAKSSRTALTYYKKSLPPSDPGILWGGVNVPTEEATTHFLVIGTTGSGKTVTLRLFMQSVLSGIGQLGSRKRAVIYDPKTEMVSILEGMGFAPGTIVIMNPFDQRCRPWWISADIETATDAETLANILVPEKKDSKDDEFWRNATILLIKAVVRYLNRVVPRRWTFRDLLLALRTESIIRKMIDDDSNLSHYAQTFGSDKTSANIMATLIAKVERFEPIAALWHKAETVYGNQPISLTEWTEASQILVLGRSETAETQMSEINRVLITRLSELLLEKRETRAPETFIILDELGSLGNLKSLLKLATEGRSKGVSLAAGFQAEGHLQSNFTKEIAETILGQFNHIAALKIRDETTAKWVSGLMGKVRGIRYTESVSRGNWESGPTRTIQEHYYEEDAVMTSELTGIPAFRPSQGIGLQGFYMGHVNWWHTYPPSIVKSLSPKADEDRNFVRMPKTYQDIEPWDDADLERLDILHLFGKERREVEREFGAQELSEELEQFSEELMQEIDWNTFFKERGLIRDVPKEHVYDS